MSAKRLILIAAAGSAALLLGALAFQYLGGLAPCKLCITQRWPHLGAVLIGAVVLAGAPVWLAWAGALAAATTSAYGLYHTGVERAWWEGPDTCTSGDISTLSNAELLETVLNAPLVRCDEVVWSLAGLSMASWNGIFSLALVGLWVAAARRA